MRQAKKVSLNFVTVHRVKAVVGGTSHDPRIQVCLYERLIDLLFFLRAVIAELAVLISFRCKTISLCGVSGATWIKHDKTTSFAPRCMSIIITEIGNYSF